MFPSPVRSLTHRHSLNFRVYLVKHLSSFPHKYHRYQSVISSPSSDPPLETLLLYFTHFTHFTLATSTHTLPGFSITCWYTNLDNEEQLRLTDRHCVISLSIHSWKYF
ncbi:hypothetical protein E2C01_046779 [Portunus trituberculatus]|uniref:Uncharacterized protein n=1 Tax=Portunus trituberculatus TaxID=210409 RepID=A0A5B7G5R1_PORTR|nr:hypothetical protein [Portunus trituberculatus]